MSTVGGSGPIAQEGGNGTAVPGGGMAIGGAVVGATPGRGLFADAGPVLADNAAFTFDKTTGTLSATLLQATALTPTRIPFVGTAGLIVDDAAFAWDNVDKQLVLGNGSIGKPSLILGDDTSGLYRSAVNEIAIATAGTGRWKVDASGNFMAVTDNTIDIGASGGARPRDLFLGRNANFAGNITFGNIGGAIIIARGANSRAGMELPSGAYAYLMGNLTAAAATSATEADVILGADANRSAGFVLSVNNNMGTGAGGTRIFGVTFDGRAIIGAPNSAPTSSDMGTNTLTFYIDETVNTLKCRVKYAAGTIKELTTPIPLT